MTSLILSILVESHSYFYRSRQNFVEKSLKNVKKAFKYSLNGNAAL